MKKVFAFLLISLALYPDALSSASSCAAPKPRSRYVAVMDWGSGRILYQKNMRSIAPMASTTKIMTAIVALENTGLDDRVHVSTRASGIGGSTVGLRSGKKYTMEQLLYGLMLRSGNDCAVAIAEHTSGTVENFLDLMNAKALEIGAFDTRFTSPHGLDSEGHFTTAYDMALITRYAMNNETFRTIVGSKEASIEGADGDRMEFSNINKILWRVDGADGVKTGYTGKAGKCLVSSAVGGTTRVICVVLNSDSRWEDSARLLQYGLSNFHDDLVIDDRSYHISVPVKDGSLGKVRGSVKFGASIPISEDERSSVRIEKELSDCVEAPVYQGQQLGKLTVYADNVAIYSIPIVSDEYVAQKKRR